MMNGRLKDCLRKNSAKYEGNLIAPSNLKPFYGKNSNGELALF